MERKKLTVTEVKQDELTGKDGRTYTKLSFKAINGDNTDLWYFTFSKALFDTIKVGAVLDAEVEVSENQYGTNRKVTQIYKDGQPVGNKGGRSFGRSPEQEKLIVRQTCLKCAVEARPGATIKEILDTAAIFDEWVNSKAEVKPETPKEQAPVVANKAPEPKAETNPTQETTLPKTVKELMEAVSNHGKQYSTSWVLKNLNYAGTNEIHDPAGCYLILKELTGWEN